MADLTGGIASALREGGDARRMGGNLLLDLEPRAFLSAMDELGLPADQREFLLREYRTRNSPLTRLYEGIQSVREGDEGRTRASILPMTRPEGMTGYEALRSGEAEFAVPEFLLGGAEGLLNVLDMPGATLRGPVSEAEMGEVALETAGALALPLVGARPDPNVARMFGGRGTTNQYANKAMDRAEELRDQGLDPEDIWRRTAEEFPDAPASILPDGRPFYEMSDAEAVTRDLAVERAQKMAGESLAATDPEERALLRQESRRLLAEQPSAGVLPTPLSDVMSHPQLYRDFPEVADIPTAMKASLSGHLGEYFRPTASSPRGAIQVSSVVSGRPGKEAGVLLHEGQHGIANLFTTLPRGTNARAIRSYIDRRGELFDTYARAADDAASDLTSKIDALEQRFFDQGDLEGADLLDKIVDPLFGEIAVVQEAARAPGRAFYKALDSLADPYETSDVVYPLYMRDPGEGLARLTAARRELSMSERRETTPMETLRQETVPLEWSDLEKLQNEYDLSAYLEQKTGADLSRPRIDGVSYSNYIDALYLTMDEIPRILSEITDKARMAATPEARQQVVAEGREQVRNTLRGKLKGFQ